MTDKCPSGSPPEACDSPVPEHSSTPPAAVAQEEAHSEGKCPDSSCVPNSKESIPEQSTPDHSTDSSSATEAQADTPISSDGLSAAANAIPDPEEGTASTSSKGTLHRAQAEEPSVPPQTTHSTAKGRPGTSTSSANPGGRAASSRRRARGGPSFSEDPVAALDAHPVGREVKRLVMVIIASCIFALNLKTFVRTGNLIPGGVNGITLLTQQITSRFWGFEPPFSLMSWTLNTVPIYLGFRFIGKKFTFYSLIVVLLTGALTDLFPALPVTSDPLLIAVFGGLVNGAAASLCLFADATSGGTDIVSMYLSKIHGFDAWNIILAGNVVVLIIAGLLLGWERALYSIIYQFTTTQVLHFLHRRYQKHTLLIITERPEEVYREIHAITHHNATRFRGEGCYKGAPRTLLYSVVSSEEVKKVIRQVRAIDPDAFINSIRTENISGRFYQRPSD